MNKSKTWRTRLRSIFMLDEEADREAFREVLPFFLLVTLAVGGILLYTGLNTDFSAPLWRTVFILLSVMHVAFYWMLLVFVATDRRTIIYLTLQGTLVFTLIHLSGSPSLAVALYGALLGNTVGTLGKKRMSLVAVVLYLILAVINITLLSGFQVVVPWFLTALPVILFSSFFAYFLNKQMTALDNLQTVLNELEVAHSQLAKYTLQIENLTVTAERERMARELHDTLAQGLAGLILQLEAAEHHNQQGQIEKTQVIIEQAMGRARTTLADARRAINDLRADLSDIQALTQALNKEVRRFEDQTGIDCQFAFNLPDYLDEQLAEHILRTTAEGLWNIAQHAQAKSVTLTIEMINDELQIEISDDGVGFDPSAVRGQHYGLVGVRERARLVVGKLTIDSTLGQGTRLEVTIPLTTSETEVANV